jgi:hypothetical protein
VQEVADALVQGLSVDEQQTLLRALKKRHVDLSDKNAQSKIWIKY